MTWPLLACVAAGTLCCLFGRGIVRFFGGVAALAAFTAISYAHWSAAGVVWNPHVTQNQLVGEWHDGAQVLRIDEMGYTLGQQSDRTSERGKWTLTGTSLRLGPRTMRLIEWDGTLHLIPYTDPEAWDSKPGFRKTD